MISLIISRGCFKNAYELLNLGALKSSLLNKPSIFQCMGDIFCVGFQRIHLKFNTNYITFTLKDMIFIQCWKYRSSRIYKLVCIFEMLPGLSSIFIIGVLLDLTRPDYNVYSEINIKDRYMECFLYEIALSWMLQDLTDDKSALVQVMAWCRAPSHYLN